MEYYRCRMSLLMRKDAARRPFQLRRRVVTPALGQSPVQAKR